MTAAQPRHGAPASSTRSASSSSRPRSKSSPTHGFRGATHRPDRRGGRHVEAEPALLFRLARKTSTRTLIQRLLDTWLAPLRELDDVGDPLTEIGAYIRRKLEMARDFPRESRLFANEILQGAPRIADCWKAS